MGHAPRYSKHGFLFPHSSHSPPFQIHRHPQYLYTSLIKPIFGPVIPLPKTFQWLPCTPRSSARHAIQFLAPKCLPPSLQAQTHLHTITLSLINPNKMRAILHTSPTLPFLWMFGIPCLHLNYLAYLLSSKFAQQACPNYSRLTILSFVFHYTPSILQ